MSVRRTTLCGLPLADLDTFHETTALVTGASGFIGSRLVPLLAASGSRVVAISRRAASVSGCHATYQLDLSDGREIERVVSSVRPDYVFHLAGVTSAARSAELVESTFVVNLSSTVALLQAVAKTPCRRFIIAGSLEEPSVDAHGEIVPSSPYAASKHAAACYGRMFHRLFGVPVVLARIFMVYGPGQRDLRKLIPYVTTSLLRDQSPRLSSGSRPVDWVYVDDVARDLALAAVAPGIEGRTLDIGTGVLTPVAAVAAKLGELVRTRAMPIFGEVADRAGEQVRAADTQSRRELLGDVPLTSLESGLRQTVEWYEHALQTGEVSPP